METNEMIEQLTAQLNELKETVAELTKPKHGSRTILGVNVRVSPDCVLVSNENASITLGDHTQVWRGADWVGPIHVGKRVFINQGSYIRPGVTIEDDVSIGPFVRLISDTHDISTGSRRTGTPRKDPIRVGRGTWIGAGATVLGGVTIGSRSILAAGAVVINDVPDNVIVAGVPAKIVRHISDGEKVAELDAVGSTPVTA
ncbi:acyltransferase [Arthrobacter sp. NPDC055585]